MTLLKEVALYMRNESKQDLENKFKSLKTELNEKCVLRNGSLDEEHTFKESVVCFVVLIFWRYIAS